MDRDFRLYAKDRGVSMSVLNDIERRTNNYTYPSIIEERTSAMRMTEMNVFSRLIQERIVFLSGDVTPDSMDVISAQLLYLDSVSNKDISLYINSCGGDCYSGLELVSTMNFIKSNVSTIVLGLAASMGAVIASSGEKGKRYGLKYSRFMIHQPSSSLGRSNFTDSKIHLQEMESIRKDLYGLLSENSGKTFDEIVNLCENGDRYMKIDEAIELGFLDKKIEKK